LHLARDANNAVFYYISLNIRFFKHPELSARRFKGASQKRRSLRALGASFAVFAVAKTRELERKRLGAPARTLTNDVALNSSG